MDENYTIAIASDIQEKIKILGGVEGRGRGEPLWFSLYSGESACWGAFKRHIIATKTRFPDM